MRGPRGSLTSSRSADTSAPSTGRTRGRYSDARTQAQCRTTISRETTEAMSTGDDSRRTRGDPRVTGRRPAPGRTEVDAGPSLPDRLVAARERKGVDLFRAERDTKIRSRYLAALERGDYRELPGAVYTKGFLRNYAVLLFGAYLAVQLLRFAKPPTLAVTNPPTAVVDVAESATSFRLEGTSTPGATVTVSVPGQTQPQRVTALSVGSWSVDVDLRRGTNVFDIDAVDPDTGKPTETPQKVIINVPYLVIQAPTLTVNQPQDGATYENGAIPVEGVTAN